MLVSEAVTKFLQVWHQDGKAPATIRFYESRLKRFRELLGDRDVTTLKPFDILEYLRVTDEGLSTTTRRHNRVAIETLQKWLRTVEVLKRRWCKKLVKPPMGRRDRLPTAAETEAILSRSNDAFCLIYTALRLCGARPGELCRATIADWRWTEGVILLEKHKTQKKTHRPRIIPVSSHLLKLLDKATAGRESGPIFLTTCGKAWSPEHLSRSYTRARKAAGLSQGLVLYLARHEAGTRLCREVGLAIAKDVLGHTSVNTTQRYVHLDLKDMLKGVEKLG